MIDRIHDSLVSSKDLGEAGAPVDEIEITPKMIEAGENAISRFFGWELDSSEKIVCAVFSAMMEAYVEAMEDHLNKVRRERNVVRLQAFNFD